MNAHPRKTLLALVLALAAAPGFALATSTPGSFDRTALRARCDDSLATLRAGRVLSAAPLLEEEREALRAAEAQSPELLEMRGGDTTTILLIVVIVLIVILLI